MSGLVVRGATAGDIDVVWTISRRPFSAQWSRDAYAAELERADSVFLIADDGEVRGYTVARWYEDEARLLDFAVAEDGRGVGRSLWQALAGRARERSASRLTWEVSSANTRALSFYTRAGARVVGRRAKFYNDGSDAVLMDFLLT